MFPEENESGPVGEPQVDGILGGDTLTVAVEPDGLHVVPNGEEATEPPFVNLPGHLPLSPQNEGDPGSEVGAVTAPVFDEHGQIYAIEVRRLVTLGGYNNLTIGAHALVDPDLGVERTMSGLDAFVSKKLKELGGPDIENLEEQRANLRREIWDLERRKERVDRGIRDSRELFAQASKTLRAVGVEPPFVPGENPFAEPEPVVYEPSPDEDDCGEMTRY